MRALLCTTCPPSAKLGLTFPQVVPDHAITDVEESRDGEFVRIVARRLEVLGFEVNRPANITLKLVERLGSEQLLFQGLRVSKTGLLIPGLAVTINTACELA